MSFLRMIIGPMVYGTAFCPLAMKDAVKDLGVAGMYVIGLCKDSVMRFI